MDISLSKYGYSLLACCERRQGALRAAIYAHGGELVLRHLRCLSSDSDVIDDDLCYVSDFSGVQLFGSIKKTRLR